MNATLNKVTLIGNMGDNIKLTYFDKDNCIGNFYIATDEIFVSHSSGERFVNTQWHPIVVRNKMAEACEKHLTKGDMVYIEGQIKYKTREDTNGTLQKTVEIHAHEVKLLSSKHTPHQQ